MTLLALLVACRPDSGLTKFNAPPEAQITAPLGGERALEGSTFTLRGAASDADDTLSSLTTRWWLDGVLTCETPAGADGSTSCPITVPAADAAIVLEVLDPEGQVASASATLGVDPDGAPTASIVSPGEDDVLYSDQLILFRGLVSDAEDAADTLVAWWEDAATGRLEDVDAVPTSEGEVIGYGLLTEGPHALELHVLDRLGNEAVATQIVEVGPPNSAPSCAITAPADGAVSVEGAALRLEAAVSDADVEPPVLRVTWSSDKDGDLGASTPDSTGFVGLSVGTLSVDTHRITLQVQDELGELCADAIYVTVGTPPSIDIDAPTDGDVLNEDASLALSATVSDAQDLPGVLSVLWESDLDGPLWSGAPDGTGAVDTFVDGLSRGEHVLTATVTDSDGLEARASVRATVNGLPDAPVVTLTPASPGTDDALRVSFTAASTDPEGDPLTYGYAWSRNGVPSSASTSDVLPASATTRGDAWSVTVRASDGWGEGPAGTASVTIGNTAPSLAAATITPSPARRGDDLACSASGWSDADGDADASTYAWAVNGAAAGTGSVLSAGFDAGDVVTCTVTPFDGIDAGTPVTASTTITNSGPTVSSVTLSPSTVRTDDTITASATYADADGDTLVVTWAWYVDGALVPSATGTTLSGDWFDRDQEVVAEVTVDDGAANATLASSPLVVANSAPGAAGATITPSSPSAGDALVCAVSADATDADGDTLAYTVSWTVDGAAFGGASSGTWPGDTVPGSAVGWEETWTCTLVADDGTDSGPAATASVTTSCALGSESACPADDCLDVLTSGASTGDGWYWIDPAGSGAFEAWCDMTTDGGGWTRIADEDYATDACPSTWTKSSTWCVRPSTGSGSIATATWDTWGITWEEVYGQVDGRLYFTTDGFHGPRDITSTTSIDDAYVDGVSITHGASGARQHVWSLAGGHINYAEYTCPAAGGDAPPSYVGSNYGCVQPPYSPAGWSTLSTGTFFHTASGPSTDDIDIRIMLDQGSSDEDAGVDAVTLYVR